MKTPSEKAQKAYNSASAVVGSKMPHGNVASSFPKIFLCLTGRGKKKSIYMPTLAKATGSTNLQACQITLTLKYIGFQKFQIVCRQVSVHEKRRWVIRNERVVATSGSLS